VHFQILGKSGGIEERALLRLIVHGVAQNNPTLTLMQVHL
jgi:hypothetical protein